MLYLSPPAAGMLATRFLITQGENVNVFDLRSTMLAGATWETEDELGVAMSGSVAALFMTLSCLNEAEWQTAGPFLDLELSDRESLQCMRETLGGPAELAAALQSRAAGESPPALTKAEAQCEL